MKNYLKGAAVAAVVLLGIFLIGGRMTEGQKPEVMAEMPGEEIIIEDNNNQEVSEEETTVDVQSTRKVAPNGETLGEEYIAPTYSSSEDVTKGNSSVTGNTVTEFKKETNSSSADKEVEDAKKDSNKKVETIKEDIVVITENKKEEAPANNTKEEKKIDTNTNAVEVKSEESKSSNNTSSEKKNTSAPSDVIDFEALGF